MRFIHGEATDKLKRKKPSFASILNSRITIECLNLSVSMNLIIGFKCEKRYIHGTWERERERKMTMICLAKSPRNDTSFKEILWKPTQKRMRGKNKSQSMEFRRNWIWNLSSFPCSFFIFASSSALVFHFYALILLYFSFHYQKKENYTELLYLPSRAYSLFVHRINVHLECSQCFWVALSDRKCAS